MEQLNTLVTAQMCSLIKFYLHRLQDILFHALSGIAIFLYFQAQTRGPLVSSQAHYHWATVLPTLTSDLSSPEERRIYSYVYVCMLDD